MVFRDMKKWIFLKKWRSLTEVYFAKVVNSGVKVYVTPENTGTLVFLAV